MTDPFYTWRGDIQSDYYVRVFSSAPIIWITGALERGIYEYSYTYVVLPHA